MSDLPEATTTSKLFLAHLVDATIEQLGINTHKQTDCACVFKFNCSQQPTAIINIAHVSGTKEASTLTSTEYPTTCR